MSERDEAERLLAETESALNAATCVYVGRCNSSGCPKHGGATTRLRALCAALRASLAREAEAYERAAKECDAEDFRVGEIRRRGGEAYVDAERLAARIRALKGTP